jgi:hypothetical protein
VVGLIGSFLVFLGLFFLLVELGERGGDIIFSNLRLIISYFISAFSAIGSFFIGLIVSFRKKQREYSILVYFCMIIGFIVFLWVLANFIGSVLGLF